MKGIWIIRTPRKVPKSSASANSARDLFLMGPTAEIHSSTCCRMHHALLEPNQDNDERCSDIIYLNTKFKGVGTARPCVSRRSDDCYYRFPPENGRYPPRPPSLILTLGPPSPSISTLACSGLVKHSEAATPTKPNIVRIPTRYNPIAPKNNANAFQRSLSSPWKYKRM